MAANETVAINSPEAQTAIASFNTQVANFEQALSQMNTVVDNLALTFIGLGSQAFVGTTTAWTTDAKRLNDDLQAIAAQLGQTVTVFGDTDTQIAQGFKRLGV